MVDSVDRTFINLSNFTGYGDLYKKLAEIFNTEEQLLASGSFYIDELLNTKALEKEPWDDLCSVASKIIIYQKQILVFNNEEVVRNEVVSQESGESNEDFNLQNMLNEEGRECEEDFDSQNNEEGKHKQLSLRVLATVISSTLRRASKTCEMFWHASSPVISCIIINTNDLSTCGGVFGYYYGILVDVLLLLRLDYHASHHVEFNGLRDCRSSWTLYSSQKKASMQISNLTGDV